MSPPPVSHGPPREPRSTRAREGLAYLPSLHGSVWGVPAYRGASGQPQGSEGGELLGTEGPRMPLEGPCRAEDAWRARSCCATALPFQVTSPSPCWGRGLVTGALWAAASFAGSAPGIGGTEA